MNKIAVTHWFRIDKAKRELGYRPQTLPFKPVVDWFLERGHGRQHRRGRGGQTALIAVALALLAILLYLWRIGMVAK